VADIAQVIAMVNFRSARRDRVAATKTVVDLPENEANPCSAI
jgi:hypothetical protein